MSYRNGRRHQHLQKLETASYQLPASGRTTWQSGVLSEDDERRLTAELRHQLFEVEIDGKTGAQVVIEALINRAKEGEFKSIEEIFNRIDGDAKRHAEKVALPKLAAVSECHAQKLADAFYDDRSDLPCD
jgi:heme oxygenase